MPTSQNTRLLETLMPESAPVDDRTLADRLVFAARFGKLLRYYDAGDHSVGDWAAFFESEPMVRYALVAATDLEARQEQCALWLDRLHRIRPNKDGDWPNLDTLDMASLRSAIGVVSETFRTVDSWRRFFLDRPDERAFREHVDHVILDTLAPCRERYRRLLAVLKIHSPGILQPLTLEEAELDPDLWRTQVGTGPETAEGSGLDAWAHFASGLAECLGVTWRAEKALVTKAQERLNVLLAAPTGLSPHFALYLAFVRQLGYVQARVNAVTGRHLDFFYRNILRETPRPPVPDRAFVAFEARPLAEPFVLPAGTRLLAPAVAGSDAGVFETETPLEISGTKVARLAVVRLSAPSLAPPFSTDAAPASATRQSPAPSSLGLAIAPAGDGRPAASPAAPTPPPDPPKARPAEGMAKSPDGGVALECLEPEMGFAVSSPCLALSGGHRTIRVTVGFREPSHLPTPSASASSDVDSQILPIKPAPCRVVYSGPSGWAAVPAERVRVLTLKFRNTPATQALELSVVIHLGPGDPPVADFDRAKLPGDFGAGSPVLQVLFPQPLAAFCGDPASVPPGVASAFARASVGRVQITARVCDFTPPVVYTQSGKAPTLQPFPLLGGQPKVGSAVLVGAPELFRKMCTGLRLKINWLQLPDPKRFPDPLRGYYREYIQVAEEAGLVAPSEANATALPDTSTLFEAKSYLVSLACLTDKTWRPCPTKTGPTAGLFEMDANGALKSTTRVEVAPEFVLPRSPRPLQSADLAYGSQTTTGFLRLTMVGPDYGFGHLVYPRVAAAVAMHNARSMNAKVGDGPSGSIPSAAPQDPIRVSQTRSFLGRLFHPGGGPEATTLPDHLFSSLRRAGSVPADIQVLLDRANLPPTHLVDRLLQLRGKLFTRNDPMHAQVAKLLRLGDSQVEERDRTALLATIHGWFQRLLANQRAIAGIVQSLRIVSPPTWVGQLLHLGDAPTRYALPKILFQALQSAPVLPPALAVAVQALSLAPSAYPLLMAGLEGKTFRNPEELNTLVLGALKQLTQPVAPAGTPGAPDLNALLLQTYQWFAQLSGTPPPSARTPILSASATLGLLPSPNPPLTPIASGLSLSYTATATLDPATPHSEGQIYRIHPLFTVPVDLTRPEGSTLLPEAAHGARLYVGMQNVRRNRTLSLLFIPSTVTPPTRLGPPSTPTWSLFHRGQWEDCLPGGATQDDTHGLTRPGILHIDIPEGVAGESPSTASDLLWLRAKFPDPDHGLEGVQFLPQPVVARRVVDPSSTGEGAVSKVVTDLPANRLSQLQPPDSRIKCLHQPRDSFGGRPAESSSDFYLRVSERLRHKGRAWTAWDYERLVLQQFPEVFFAECLGPDSGDPAVSPGSVLLIVLPTLPRPPALLPPGFTRKELAAIEDWVQQRASPHVLVRVANPSYRRVFVSAAVAFKGADSRATLSQRLDDELKGFLSPWVYRQTSVRLPERQVERSAVAAFVVARPYVERLEGLDLWVSTKANHLPPGSSRYALVGTEAATGAPSEHLLTADRHCLTPI